MMYLKNWKKMTLVLIFMMCFLFITVNSFARITVVSTRGEVAFMDDKAGRWMPLAVGAQLQEGVKISTGINANVRLNLGGNTVDVGPLSMMKVYKNQVVSGTQDTRIGMRRGEMTADVTGGEGVRTVFRVATPVATSSVRGTTKRITTGPSGTRMDAPKGSIRVDSKNGQTRILSGRLGFDMPKGAMEPRPVLASSINPIVGHGSTDKEHLSAELLNSDAPQVIENLLIDMMPSLDVILNFNPASPRQGGGK